MSKGQKLRALVNERLTAAAAEIFELFERTIAEYEQEVLRFKQTNDTQQQLLDSHTADVQTVMVIEKNVSSRLEPPHIKQEPEPRIKQEEEQLQEFPFFAPVCVKTEDDEDKSSVLHQRATEENREETNGEDCGAEAGCSSDPLTQLHSDSEEHTADHSEDWTLHWEPPAHTSTRAELDHSLETVAMNPDSSVTDEGGTPKPHRCSECGKRFRRKSHLQKHLLIHSGQKPFKCSYCDKRFIVFYNLKRHMGIHTGEKPYSCSVCQKCFRDKTGLDYHLKTHTGEKPFSCSVCRRGFSRNTCLTAHMRLHTGERPYSCPVCKKSYPQNKTLRAHMATHIEATHGSENSERSDLCSHVPVEEDPGPRTSENQDLDP